VHWCDYPEPDAARIDDSLEQSMDLVSRVVNVGRSVRNASSLRVRQPLRRLAIAGAGERDAERIRDLSDLIRDELNVKEIVFLKERGELLTTTVKPNFPVLGKKAGGAMKDLAARIQEAAPADIQSGILRGGWEVEAGGRRFTLIGEDVAIHESSRAPWVAQADGSMAVAIDPTLDDDLRAEGLVREFAHRIQNLRKGAELDVTDRIRLTWELSPELLRACEKHERFIRDEVLATELVQGAPAGEAVEEWTFDGERARVGIQRVNEGG
ncbi:MAG TPA: DUF5915 domain-containing protein, partial [Thermoplasmata archaeon]|nr:DUF5915 domain-containing protein [Thermoplasmata archaeon]